MGGRQRQAALQRCCHRLPGLSQVVGEPQYAALQVLQDSVHVTTRAVLLLLLRQTVGALLLRLPALLLLPGAVAAVLLLLLHTCCCRRLAATTAMLLLLLCRDDGLCIVSCLLPQACQDGFDGLLQQQVLPRRALDCVQRQRSGGGSSAATQTARMQGKTGASSSWHDK